MDPSVLSYFFIQCDEEDEIQEFIVGTKLTSRKWVFLPITNSCSFVEASSHWSLLLLHVPSLSFMHYDSASKYNLDVRDF
jgi:Ulp1 family protease